MRHFGKRLPIPVLQRCQSKMFFDIFAKETDIGEIQFEGNLFNRKIGLQQVVFDASDGAFRNPVHSRATALFLADRAKVLRRDQQLLGVAPDFTLGVFRVTEQGYETLEQAVFL